MSTAIKAFNQVFISKLHISQSISLVFLILGVVFAAIDPNNWGGWLFFGLSFGILLFEQSIKDNSSLYLICFFVLFFYHLVSFLHVNTALPWCQSSDATMFHLNAQQVAFSHFLPEIGSSFYINFLGFLYSLNLSQFFGQEINVCAFALFLIYLCKIMKLLGVHISKMAVVILVCALLPNYLFWLTMLLREVWELLLFTMILYYGLVYQLRQNRSLLILLIVILCLLWILFHRGFFLYVPFLLFMILLWPLDTKKKALGKMFFCGILVLGATGVVFFVARYCHVPGFQSIYMVGFKVLQNLRESIPIGNTNYFIDIDYSSILSFLKGVWLLLYYYLFTPIPWQVDSWDQPLIMMYVLFRITLLTIIVLSYKKQLKLERRVIVWFLVIYFSFSWLWALGVSNYGAALRHQILTDWILILCGIKCLLVSFSNRNSKICDTR